MRSCRPAPASRARTLGRAIPALVAALLVGCAAVEHGVNTRKVAGRTLATTSPEGAERLAAESEVDSTLRAFVAENGRPNYIHVVSRQKLYALPDETRVIWNAPRSIAYLVRVGKEAKTEQQYREDFLASVSNNLPREISYLASSERIELYRQWYKEVEAEMNVQWKEAESEE